MSSHPDTAIRTLHVAIALNKCERTITNMIHDGRIPRPDVYLERGKCAWKFATLKAWNPTVAAQVAKLIEAAPISPTV